MSDQAVTDFGRRMIVRGTITVNVRPGCRIDVAVVDAGWVELLVDDGVSAGAAWMSPETAMEVARALITKVTELEAMSGRDGQVG